MYLRVQAILFTTAVNFCVTLGLDLLGVHPLIMLVISCTLFFGLGWALRVEVDKANAEYLQHSQKWHDQRVSHLNQQSDQA